MAGFDIPVHNLSLHFGNPDGRRALLGYARLTSTKCLGIADLALGRATPICFRFDALPGTPAPFFAGPLGGTPFKLAFNLARRSQWDSHVGRYPSCRLADARQLVGS